jgi:hypothetical protein
MLTLDRLHVELTAAPPPASFTGSAEKLGTLLRAYPEIFLIKKQQEPDGFKISVSINRVKHALGRRLLGLAKNVTVVKTNRYSSFYVL